MLTACILSTMARNKSDAQPNKKLSSKQWMRLYRAYLKRTTESVEKICDKYGVSKARFYKVRPELERLHKAEQEELPTEGAA